MQILLVTLLFFCGYVSSQELPSYITLCVRTRPDFHQCCIDSAVKAIPHILKGDKRFKVPSLSPLKVPRDVIIDFKSNKINITLLMDYLKILGRYEIDGQLLVPLRGNGDLNITTENTQISYLVDFSIVNRGGQDYIQMDKDDLQLRSEKVYYHLDNLFGNPQLSEQTNRILNENANEVGNEINGPVRETIRSIVNGLFANYLTKYPLDQVFLKE
ncbi:hemolymph juvenile hormone binding protein (JHBP) [Popillia japonica]|uniref:Hemolymph juvenile hormone binding protein (JHBP) n=1 Tax=Popillia japonica TaxID=7064 RepID=A0AAW1MZQ1_POPJA